MEKYILTLDQGTTSSRAVLFNLSGSPVAMIQYEYEQIFPKTGYVEHDPMAIYSSQIKAATDVVEMAGVKPGEILCIGITNQRETTIVWDRTTGKPVYNAIVWQCRRTAEICDRAKADGLSQYIFEKTGLVIDAYFSATKIKWILDNIDPSRKLANSGRLLFGTVDTWLIWNLTGGKSHITDSTNASRTMLYNIEKLEFDDRLLSYFSIPKAMLAEVKPSCGFFGRVIGVHPCLDGVEIRGVAGDQQASLFGQACFNPGDVKNTYGTGCFMLMNTGRKRIKSKNRLLSTIAWDIGNGPEYALEGSVFNAGTVIKWLRDELGIISSAQESQQLAMKSSGTKGLYFVPAFTGLGSPYWDMYARGTIVGISRGTSRADMVRAALESIAYQSLDLAAAIESDAETKINSLRADGGASANDFLMQFQADMLDRSVLRGKNIETSALGAAYFAGLSAGVWNGIRDIKECWSYDREFKPSIDAILRDELYSGWKRAVERSLNWENV